MPQISQFWLDYAAGRIQLDPFAWAEKDAQIERDELDELPLNLWMRIDVHEQRRLLRAAMAEAA